jgi:NAD(P)-dependent dehydrogenase (short-subunit alcohol dehydrogenase family)
MVSSYCRIVRIGWDNIARFMLPVSQVIVITGAGSGVGRAVASHFAQQGWSVALVDRRQHALDETLALLPDAGQCAATFLCDVGSADDVSAMGTAVLTQFRQVDVVVNAAGMNVTRRSLAMLTPEDWRGILDVNLTGAFYCAQAFLPSMRERGIGTIVNINSDVGRRARELAGAAYVASKFGLAGLTEQINAEERRHGIRACSIFPRDINTPLLDRRPEPPPPEVRARMIQPEDIAACVWLAATLPPRAAIEAIDVTSP